MAYVQEHWGERDNYRCVYAHVCVYVGVATLKILENRLINYGQQEEIWSSMKP